MKLKEKNIKRICFIALAIAIIIAMLAVLISDFVVETKTPSYVVEHYLNAVKADDSAKIAKYYSGNDIEEEIEGSDNVIGSAISDKLNKFEFEILDETINDDKAIVKVSLKTYKIGSAVINALFAMSEDAQNGISKEYTEYLNEELSDCEFGYEKEVYISLTKTDNKWMIDKFEDQGAFMDAIAGGLYSYLAQISSLLNVE